MAGQPTFFTRVAGDVCGPFDVAGLRELVGLRHLLPTDDLSRDGGTTWAAAGRYKGLFPAAAAPVAALAVAGPAEPAYRFTQGGQSAGPLPVSALRELAGNGALLASDLVWADGDATSTAAGQHPALAGAFARAAPPLAYRGPQPVIAAAAADAEPASFWLRFAAYVVDAVCIGVASGLLAGAIGPALGLASSYRLGQAVALVGGWLYYALFESSALRATPGKMYAGLLVTDLRGQRLGFGRATGRYFGIYVSAATLGVGFLMAIWTERRQALHDVMAGTLVVVR